MHRRLAAANPAAYEPDLAGSLNNLRTGCPRPAAGARRLAAVQEAVEVYRRLAAHEPALAVSLNNLSIHLANAGRREESERVSWEASDLGTHG